MSDMIEFPAAVAPVADAETELARERGRREMVAAQLEATADVAENRLKRLDVMRAEVNRIKRDLNVYCDCKSDLDSIVRLGAVLDAAREVVEDVDNVGRKNLRDDSPLLILAVRLDEFDGKPVSEEEHQAVHGELPAEKGGARA